MRRHDNARVSRRARRQLTAALAALAVFGFAVLPAEHIHVARTHDGRQSELVHRHFEPHGRPDAPLAVDHADDDHDVQWLTSSFTAPNTTRQLSRDNQPAARALSIPGADLVIRGTVEPLFVSVHDPPWTISSALRAPPAFLI